jgi:queuine tRNA-ribosyltransferase
MSRLNFQVQAEATHSRARAATFQTLHNRVETPIFMPVGTQATVRGMRREDLERINAPILLANTYHLLLRPGIEVFQSFGGLHPFTGWKRSFLTDSGGFQAFSLSENTVRTEDGITFKSLLDGRPILLTPERSIEMQRALGSDIMMVFDECVPSTSAHDRVATSMQLTHRWALRSMAARQDSPQSLFGIVQGACFEDLRHESAMFLREQPFDGLAIGGLAVGETKEEREHFTSFVTNLLPKNLPRYLMGVGTPLDIVEAVHRGVDMFDCIIPTAHAQHGTAFTHNGIIRIVRGAYRLDTSPLDASCSCLTCTQYTKGYIHHLMKAREGLGWWLLAYHNLHFYQELMREMRGHILADTFAAYYQQKRVALALYDGEEPQEPPAPRPEKRPLQLGNYELKTTQEGHTLIQQRSSGESMHPTGDPNEEAKIVYLTPVDLPSRLAPSAPSEAFIIWDVGLGAAHNAMSVVRALEELQPQRAVHLLSFENDLDSLRLALLHVTRFPHLKHAGPHLLCEKRAWESKQTKLRWQLLEGDFLQTMSEATAPDFILYDPFSFKADSVLWGVDSFQKLFARCTEKATMLCTYSTSTAVRAALLAAGFFVAIGEGAGQREASTIAVNHAGKQVYPALSYLDHKWLARWEKSSAKFPQGVVEKESFESLIRAHPLFGV